MLSQRSPHWPYAILLSVALVCGTFLVYQYPRLAQPPAPTRRQTALARSIEDRLGKGELADLIIDELAAGRISVGTDGDSLVWIYKPRGGSGRGDLPNGDRPKGQLPKGDFVPGDLPKE